MPSLANTFWNPVLSGPSAEAAWKAVREVSNALEQVEDWTEHGGSLSRGAIGAAILFGYLARATGDERALSISRHLQDVAGDLLAQSRIESGLYGGFIGIGWAASHLRDLLEPGAEDPASEIDDAVCRILDQRVWKGPYDLINGLVGHGVYGLERLETGAGREILARVIGHLECLALPKDEGLAWFTPSWQLPQWQRDIAPRGYWNLGLAHGIPGVIALMGRAIQADVEGAIARRLLDGGVAWMLARRNPEGAQGWFNSSLAEGETWVPNGSRVAWCYGDLGLASALLMASRDAGRKDWESEALQILREVAARPRETRGIRDACLCHGTSGNALIFLRLYHATHENCFLKAAHDHLDWTMSFQDSKRPFGGFPTHHLDDNKQSAMKYIPGLLEGNIGVALTLVAALTDHAPDWDRHLLVSLAPMSRA